MNEYLVFFVLLEDLFFIDYVPYLTDQQIILVIIIVCMCYYASSITSPDHHTLYKIRLT